MKVCLLKHNYILACILPFLFASCTSTAVDIQKTPVVQHQTLPAATAELLNLVDATAMPVLPYIVEPIGCNSAGLDGHILFMVNMRGTAEGGKGSRGELHIMDGNACDHHLVMRGASGSPDWSADGKRIFVGCQDNQYICVLDAPATLASCLNTPSENECTPVIVEQYSLPEERIQKNIGTLSWSANGDKLLVPIEDGTGGYTYLLHLGGEGKWQLIGEDALEACDLSPVNNELICGGISRVSLSDIYVVGYHVGRRPEWSPDGKKFVFYFQQLEDKDNPKESQTIMVWTIDAENIPWKVIHEPAPFDKNNWSRRSVVFNSSSYRRFSWSPDERYIVFVGNYRNERDSEIFRLDMQTGEIVVLTTKLGDGHYEAPAWGP